MQLSIVSGTYRRLHSLKDMVASVRRSVGNLSYEIVLVGVAGDTATAEWATAQPDVVWIEQPGLQGAISAFNEGARRATGKYVVFSNDDLTFLDDAIARAYSFMEGSPDVGIGCFYTDRSGRTFHVAVMPAHYPDGRMTNAYYGGIVIIPRWLGNALDWWTLPGAKTYGGDNVLCARAIEAGWQVVPVDGARIHEGNVNDELRRLNNPPSSDNHPDTTAYLRLFPRGPELGHSRSLHPPHGFYPQRILYAPIYEQGHKIQHEQKFGLRRALQSYGLVREVDYQTAGAEAILAAAKEWQPDLVLIQLHYPEPFTPKHAQRLRQMLPAVRLVSWNGDVYPMAAHPKYGDDYCAMLRHFDLHTVVNASALPDYAAKGVVAKWWQNAYEPAGVGHEPDSATPKHDVIFMGNGYSPSRHALGEVLYDLPYNVGIYGDYWPGGSSPSTLYDFRAGCKLYRNARIALGDSEWSHSARGFVSNRPFQAMAAGNCLMLQQTFEGCEDMLGLVDGVHLVLWTDYADLRAKLDYYLAHEEERAAIALAGHREVLRNHSFKARVAQLMDWLSEKHDYADPVLSAFYDPIAQGDGK